MTDKEKYVLDHYEIREDGKIYSPITKKFLKFRVDKDGYFDVSLKYDDNGNRMPFRVHRLVALKYIPQPEGYNVVNHKDLNKQNNNISNLEWSTVALNTQHGYDNCAYKNIKKVKVTEQDGTVRVSPTASHAARYYGYANSTTVQHILEGIRSSHNPIPYGKRKGLKFEYTDEDVTTIERVTNIAISE